MRPGACNMLSDKRRLAEYLTEHGLVGLAPPTAKAPQELREGRCSKDLQSLSDSDFAESLWFLKHARMDEGEGVTVHVGRDVCFEAWSALPDSEHVDYVAQLEVPRPLLDSSRRKLTFRVYVVLGVIPVPSTEDGRPNGKAWSLANRLFTCRTHPKPYDPSVPDLSRHVNAVIGKDGVTFSLGKDKVPEDRVWPALRRMLIALVSPVLERLSSEEVREPDGAGALAFDMLGVDFLLDADYRPWLIEANQKPTMNPAADSDVTALRKSILDELLATVLDAPLSSRCLCQCAQGAGAWELLTTWNW